MLELRPLGREELGRLLAAHAGFPLPAPLTDAIAARAEGNPFFAEELFAASSEQGAELPQALRDLLLQRVARLDHPTQGVLRLVAAAGREVGYTLLRATAELPDGALRDSLRTAVEGGVLVAEPESRSFRLRHALLAEAIYTTILPGERDDLHARLAEELTRSEAAGPAELAPHWAAAGRTAEALAASVEAARQAEAVFGLAEAHAHLERALALWPVVPGAAELTRLDLAELCVWTARLTSHVGAAHRAVELARGATELVGEEDPHRAALLHMRLGEYLYEIGSDDAALAALERAVELAPAELASPQRAFALASLAGGLMMAGRYAESLPISEQALTLARDLGAREAEVRALTVLGIDLARLSRGEEGIACVHQALPLGEEIGDHIGTERAYVNLTDLLMKLGRFRESARLARAGLEVIHRYGIYSALLLANQVETLLALGEWDEAERLSAAALRGATSSFSYWLCTIRADVEIGRGEFDAARAHLEAARVTLPEDQVFGLYDAYLAELALWERRWTAADATIRDGLVRARRSEAAHIRVQMCAKGVRAQAELPALARAGETPMPSATGSPGHASSSPTPVAQPQRPQRSRRTPRPGWPRPKPSTRGPAPWHGLNRGHRQVTPGSGWTGFRSRRTAAGARPRRSLRPGPLAPRRRRRSSRRTPLRPGSGPGRCCAKQNCSPSARGSIWRPRRPRPSRASPARRRASA